jgi:hypothetical protein
VQRFTAKGILSGRRFLTKWIVLFFGPVRGGQQGEGLQFRLPGLLGISGQQVEGGPEEADQE